MRQSRNVKLSVEGLDMRVVPSSIPVDSGFAGMSGAANGAYHLSLEANKSVYNHGAGDLVTLPDGSGATHQQVNYIRALERLSS